MINVVDNLKNFMSFSLTRVFEITSFAAEALLFLECRPLRRKYCAQGSVCGIFGPYKIRGALRGAQSIGGLRYRRRGTVKAT